MTDHIDNALIRHERHLECQGCGSVPGQYHAPECPSVNAFAVGRIRLGDEAPAKRAQEQEQ
ncbi:hypothetical protein ACUN9Y_09585 [Halomonas sp. V046]|uniref:hypothetical protein n=1 Tax=Halomonas sp. V046 TaxID=3459611 RepID=UPI004043B066